MSGTGRIVLVTGANRGIGFAAVEELLRAGHTVVATDLAAIDVQRFPEAVRDRVIARTLDVTDSARAREIADEVLAARSPIQILVNNAGMCPTNSGKHPTLEDCTDAAWSKTFDINLNGAMRLCRILVEHMKPTGWGRIVNVASVAGRNRSKVSHIAYCSSKAGLIGLTRCLAQDLGQYGILSNSVTPGRILTEMVIENASAEVNAAYAEDTPVKRLGRPEEVAAVIGFLASERASFVNGTIIDVTGGSFMP